MSLVYITPETSTVTADDVGNYGDKAIQTSLSTLRKTVTGVTPELCVLKYKQEVDIPSKWDALTRYDHAGILTLMATADWQPAEP